MLHFISLLQLAFRRIRERERIVAVGKVIHRRSPSAQMARGKLFILPSPKIRGSVLIVRVASPSPVGKSISQQSSFSNKGWRYVINSVARAILLQEVTALLKQTAKIIDISL